jgi:hypothetical protein
MRPMTCTKLIHFLLLSVCIRVHHFVRVVLEYVISINDFLKVIRVVGIALTS